MSKIKRISVTNLRAVKNLTADFQGCTAIITGGNNKGKSTFLKLIIEKIRGAKPELVVKWGEREGHAELELTSGEKFIWDITGEKEKLVFTTDKEIPMKLTKEIGKKYFPATFDVDVFLNSPPKKQKEMLQKISGIDFTEFDAAYAFAYEERTFANKNVKDSEARLVQLEPGIPEEMIDTSDLEKEYNGIDVHNARYDHVKEGVDERRKQVNENKLQVDLLEKQIAELLYKNNEINSKIDDGVNWLSEEKNQKKTNGHELLKKLNEQKELNKKIQLNMRAKEDRQRHEQLVQRAKDADAEVKRLEEVKAETLKSSSLPAGFGFTDDGITYDGLPFDKMSLSSSKIYIAALKLASLAIGDVRTLHFDASFLDKNSLQDIEKWAKEVDLQLLIERPDFEGGEIEYHIIKE